MYDDPLPWVVLGLILVNLIALNNWHKVMHTHIKKMNASVAFLATFIVENVKSIEMVDDFKKTNYNEIEDWDSGKNEIN